MLKHRSSGKNALQTVWLALLVAVLLSPAVRVQAAPYQAEYELDGYTLAIDAHVSGPECDVAPVIYAREKVWDAQALSAALGDSVVFEITRQGVIELREDDRFESSAYPDGAFHFVVKGFNERILEMNDYALEHAPTTSEISGFSLDDAYGHAAKFLTGIGVEPGDVVSFLPVDSVYFSEMAGLTLDAPEEGYLVHIGLRLNGFPITPYSYTSQVIANLVRGSSAITYVTRQGVQYLYIDSDATCYEVVSMGEDEPLISFEQAEAEFVGIYRELYLDFDLEIGNIAFVYLPVADPKDEALFTLVPTWGFFSQSRLDVYNNSTYIHAITGEEMY